MEKYLLEGLLFWIRVATKPLTRVLAEEIDS